MHEYLLAGGHSLWFFFWCLPPARRRPLGALGYKYNSKRVLFFVFTQGAGSTLPGEPYVAKFQDVHGNVCTREVPRPAVLSLYLGTSA